MPESKTTQPSGFWTDDIEFYCDGCGGAFCYEGKSTQKDWNLYCEDCYDRVLSGELTND